jgi:hypothetical protein
MQTTFITALGLCLAISNVHYYYYVHDIVLNDQFMGRSLGAIGLRLTLR